MRRAEIGGCPLGRKRETRMVFSHFSTNGPVRPSRAVKSGFTLVELLVVIGIIAVLVGLLLPSLRKARDSANRVACMSNMRQTSLAIQMYASVSRDYLPIGYSVYAYRNYLAYDPYENATWNIVASRVMLGFLD